MKRFEIVAKKNITEAYQYKLGNAEQLSALLRKPVVETEFKFGTWAGQPVALIIGDNGNYDVIGEGQWVARPQGGDWNVYNDEQMQRDFRLTPLD